VAASVQTKPNLRARMRLPIDLEPFGLDQAGRHGAKALTVPACVTLVPLPPRSLELNPAARPGGIEQDGRMTSLTSYPWIENFLTN
jgi:hypothetical protein